MKGRLERWLTHLGDGLSSVGLSMILRILIKDLLREHGLGIPALGGRQAVPRGSLASQSSLFGELQASLRP